MCNTPGYYCKVMQPKASCAPSPSNTGLCPLVPTSCQSPANTRPQRLLNATTSFAVPPSELFSLLRQEGARGVAHVQKQ